MQQSALVGRGPGSQFTNLCSTSWEFGVLRDHLRTGVFYNYWLTTNKSSLIWTACNTVGGIWETGAAALPVSQEGKIRQVILHINTAPSNNRQKMGSVICACVWGVLNRSPADVHYSDTILKRV